jgi:hypothetical protein
MPVVSTPIFSRKVLRTIYPNSAVMMLSVLLIKKKSTLTSKV